MQDTKQAADSLLQIAKDKHAVETSGKTGDDINRENVERARSEKWNKPKGNG